MNDLFAASRATLTADGKYRTWLERGEPDQKPIVFIMLNPSTADAERDDPTIRRCMGFAARERYRRLVVVNLFSVRATDPRVLARLDDPVGPDADAAIETAIQLTEHPAFSDAFPTIAPGIVIAAWGAAPPGPEWLQTMWHDRCAFVEDAARRCSRPLRCLGVTSGGAPRHPLFVRRDAPLIEYVSA